MVSAYKRLNEKQFLKSSSRTVPKISVPKRHGPPGLLPGDSVSPPLRSVRVHPEPPLRGETRRYIDEKKKKSPCTVTSQAVPDALPPWSTHNHNVTDNNITTIILLITIIYAIGYLPIRFCQTSRTSDGPRLYDGNNNWAITIWGPSVSCGSGAITTYITLYYYNK